MPIVEGVEEFRVLYGLDTDGDNIPEQFASYDANMEGDEVAAVRFALLVHSGKEIRSEPVAEEYVVLDSVVPTSDRFVRSVFGSTVILRNRL